MISWYALARALSASLSFGIIAKLPWIGVASLSLLWSVASLLAPPGESSLVASALFFELVFGFFLGLWASLPILAARLGAALGDQRLSLPWEAVGAIVAGVTLFGVGADRELVRAFVETFVTTPPGQAPKIEGIEALSSFFSSVLSFGLRIGFTGLAGLLVADLFNSLLGRVFPNPGGLQLPREATKALGLLASLGAIGYVLLQAAQTARHYF